MASTTFGPTASVADTKTAIGSTYTVPKGGRVRQIRYSFYQGVIDKATSGKLIIETDRQKGPFEFAVGGQMGITTTSGATGPNCPTEVIFPIGLVLSQGEIVTVSLTTAEALEENTVSIEWG